MHIRYQVKIQNAHAHLFEIEMLLDNPDANGQKLTLPAWIPGSYLIREFAKNIVELRAYSSNQEIECQKTDKDSWQCSACDGPLRIVYTVHAWDLSVRSAHLDQTHAFFNGTSLFLRPHGQDDQPFNVNMQNPGFENWKVATSMKPVQVDPDGFGIYQADNFHDLVDHPFEMGTFTKATFFAEGIPHDIIITGRHRADMERLCIDLKKICEHHLNTFGKPYPIDRYVFLIMAVGDAYGGLEHRYSTALICKRADLPLKGDATIHDGYRQFLGLCSHEYFHLWNVKRIRPERFLPYEYNKEAHTTLLWVFEGITSYLDDLSLSRTGLISHQSYLELLGRVATSVWCTPGRKRQSLADSSFDTWTKFYRPDANTPNAVVSYYTKGALVALALDLKIREATDQKSTLEDLMRHLWKNFGEKEIGVQENSVEQIAEEIAGIPLKPFFDHAIRSTEDLNLRELLQPYGVEFHLRPAESSKDKGGKKGKSNAETRNKKVSLEAATKNLTGGRIQVSKVFEEGPAMKAGLAAGDILVAFDSLLASTENLSRLCQSYRPGDRSKIHAFRRDELMTFELIWESPPENRVYFSLRDDVDESTLKRRAHWLGQGKKNED